ncbi:hypothetical protein HPB51_020216 [Rhipicephalus microplus]|uniref:VPS13-like middle region domain-containing protein n=1 Tax=Rhipicephalus microplus TaxID=6941 RepID=A0A9J6DPU7_RHIMP|nr:hypothetical protein HPB51_020216 [Rhipicephalus microplus]
MRKTKAPNNRVAIPYVPGISEQLSRVLEKAGVKVIHKPVSTLARLLPRPKDRPPRELHPGVVYKVSCSGCPACYIGESKCFPERMRQHKNDVGKMEVQRSALAEHCEKHDHKIDLDGASVIETERNLGKRLLLESWHIQHTPANVNRSLGTMPSVYVHGLRNVVERESRSHGMEYGMTWYPNRLVTRLNLKTVGIGDPTPGTLHKHIIAVPGGEVVSFEITTYEECGALGYVEMDRVDIAIKGTLGRLHFVFLYRFYLDIYNFVNRFQAAKAKIMEATANMAEAARASVETAYKQAYKMAMDIRIEAPIICLPQNCKSRNVVVMDFGVLCVSNKFKLDKVSTPESPCLLEEMVVAFDDLKLSRFRMKEPPADDGQEHPLLLPVSFKLLVTRNMNFEAHPEVPEMKNEGVLPRIELILSEEDYCAIMRTLDENLNEIPPEDEPLDWSKIPVPVVTNAPYTVPEDRYSHEHTDPVLTTEKEIKRAVRIDLAFQIDCVVLDLYMKRTDEVKEGLARLEIELLSLKGHMFHDGSYWMDTVLGNLIVDDTRVTRKSGLTRFLTRSSRSKDKLVDILYKVDKNGDFFTQIDLSKITFVYCVDFFNAIMSFYYMDGMYKKADEKRKQLQQQAAKRQQHQSQPQLQATVTETTSPPMPPYPLRNYTVQLEMDKPDIVLVADIDDPQSACIIMKGSIHNKIRQVGTTQTMMVSMDDLRMFTSYVDKFQSEHVRSEILKPTEISLNSTFTVENGQHMEISFSPIEIHVTPGAVEILSKSLGSLSAPSTEQKGDHEVEPDNSEVWNPMKLDKTKLWFLEVPTVPMATEAMETMETIPASQDSQPPRKDEQASWHRGDGAEV